MAESGILYVVATPIGNIDDLSPRARRVLEEVARVACEDTRRTGRLLSDLGIKKPLVSFHAHSSDHKVKSIAAALEAGDDIALVSDAGTPGVSDPGAALVQHCREAGIRVVPLPGPSALAAALSVAGFSGKGCYFAGFLSPKRTKRIKEVLAAAELAHTIVCYESPHRVRQFLKDILDNMGNIEVCLCREMSKVHEQYLSGGVEQVLEAEWPEKGEFTLVLHVPPKKKLKNVNKFAHMVDKESERSST